MPPPRRSRWTPPSPRKRDRKDRRDFQTRQAVRDNGNTAGVSRSDPELNAAFSLITLTWGRYLYWGEQGAALSAVDIFRSKCFAAVVSSLDPQRIALSVFVGGTHLYLSRTGWRQCPKRKPSPRKGAVGDPLRETVRGGSACTKISIRAAAAAAAAVAFPEGYFCRTVQQVNGSPAKLSNFFGRSSVTNLMVY